MSAEPVHSAAFLSGAARFRSSRPREGDKIERGRVYVAIVTSCLTMARFRFRVGLGKIAIDRKLIPFFLSAALTDIARSQKRPPSQRSSHETRLKSCPVAISPISPAHGPGKPRPKPFKLSLCLSSRLCNGKVVHHVQKAVSQSMKKPRNPPAKLRLRKPDKLPRVLVP